MTKELITELEKKYSGEWLAIEVLEKDSNGKPISGELVAHTSDRDKIFDLAPPQKGKNILITYAGPLIKKGYVALFGSMSVDSRDTIIPQITTVDLKRNKLTIEN